jgi:hypothetical protein
VDEKQIFGIMKIIMNKGREVAQDSNPTTSAFSFFFFAIFFEGALIQWS